MPAIETQAEADEKMVDLPSTGASVDVTLDDTDVKVNKEEPEDDNDNDGYSDLQEDWESDPTYGGIFNPLDNSSFPVGATDNDMDGLSDNVDQDDDNDGFSGRGWNYMESNKRI